MPPVVLAVSVVAGPLGIVVAIVVAVLLGIVVAIVVVWLPLDFAVLPESAVGPLETAVVIAFGVSNLGHPRYFASPNACSFASCSSSVGLVGGVFVGSSIDALSNDAPDSHSSNLTVSFHKRMEPFDSGPSLSHSSASDTSVLPTDATTNRRRKRSPPQCQGQSRHTSRVSRPPPVVREIR